MPVGLKDMRMQQVRQMPQAATGMALYCQKDERVDHMFHRVFEDNRLSVEYMNVASIVAEYFGVLSK